MTAGLPDGFDPAEYWDCDVRELGAVPPPEWIIPDLLYPGVAIMVAAPNAGKSMLAQQIAHHLAYGRPLGDWDAPAFGGHLVLVLDLETDWTATQTRGYDITPHGELPEDGAGFGQRSDRHLRVRHSVIPPAAQGEWYSGVYMTRADAHIAYLAQELTDLQDAGQLPSLIVIDTKEKLLGSKPQGENAYSWEAAKVGALNVLALKYGICVLLLHHTNKAGEQSGSTGNTGSAEIEMMLEKTEDPDTGGTTGLLRSTKVRRGAQFRYPLVQSPHDGTWSFDGSASAGEAISGGHKRAILQALAVRGQNNRELGGATGIDAGTLRKACTRLSRAGMIHKRFGRWWICDGWGPSRPGGGGPETPRPAPGDQVQRTGVCSVCGRLTPITDPGQTTHPTCSADAAAPCDDGTGAGEGEVGTSPDPESVDDQTETTPERSSGFAMLQASINRSRMKPVQRVPGGRRADAPWSLITEDMTGEHKWTTTTSLIDPDAPVLVLDRRGSYPSAMGSAPIVANLPSHTGEMSKLPPKTAGVFLIPRFTWNEEGIGHPLGRLAEREGPWWVTTPHLLALQRLATAGRVPAPEILDSWTGRRTDGLFTAFSREVQAARLSALAAGDEERYAEVKTMTSTAIRCLWPKVTKSPFWRPDWSVSIRAEAAVRHWVRADQAREAGATLLKLGSTDEVALARPESGGIVPYTIGRQYGQVGVKFEGTYGEYAAHLEEKAVKRRARRTR